MNKLLLIFFTAVISWYLSIQLIHYALKHGVIDTPNDRSSHSKPTPCGGGVAIAVSFSLALVYLFVTETIEKNIFFSLFLGGVIAGLGYWDDRKSLPASWRLLVHVLVSLLSLSILQVWDFVFPWNFWLPGWFNLLFLTFMAVWLLNLYNFMDGIDGIASIETLSVTGILGLLLLTTHPELALLLFVLFAAVFGFFGLNYPPAKLFMGDAGSSYLGFVLALFIVVSAPKISIWFWLIMLGVFIVDATYTLIVRIVTGQKWYQAHRSHSYQIVSRIYNSHQKVTLGVLFINLFWLFPLALISLLMPDCGLFIMFFAFSPLVVMAYRLRAGLRNE